MGNTNVEKSARKRNSHIKLCIFSHGLVHLKNTQISFSICSLTVQHFKPALEKETTIVAVRYDNFIILIMKMQCQYFHIISLPKLLHCNRNHVFHVQQKYTISF